MIYWNDTDGKSVNRARMDGSGQLEILYTDPTFNPWDLELVPDPVPEPSTAILVIVGLIGAVLAVLSFPKNSSEGNALG